MNSSNEQFIKIGMAQISPVWLNKEKTLEKIKQYITDAGNQNCDLVVFGEGLLPGYPFWLSATNASEFDSRMQKELYAHYVLNSIQIEKGELDEICTLAKEYNLSIYLGIVERAKNRGNHSLYCSLVFIDSNGLIKSIHRKLQPTYEERLVWAQGDGNGLQVHDLKSFSVGGLNCWENWMPLPRTALYAMGENLHIAVWPGSEFNTKDITRFIARESRSYVISVSGLLAIDDIPEDTPYLEVLLNNLNPLIANGGSCIAGPDGEWIIPPVIRDEKLIVSQLDFNRVLEERQNFDPVGHYSRPDIMKLTLNRERQSTLDLLPNSKNEQLKE